MNRWMSKCALARLGLVLGVLLPGVLGMGRPAGAGPNIWTAAGPHAFNGLLARDGEGRFVAVAHTSEDSTGVYRSGDGGQTWAAVGDYARGHRDYSEPVSLAAAGDGDTLLLVAHHPLGAHDYDNLGLLRSADGGATWSVAQADFTISPRYGVPPHLVFDPHDATRVYTNGRGGYYRSTDGGSTWQLMPAAANLATNATRSDLFSGRIAVDPAAPAHLVVAYEGVTGPALGVSTDGGTTWQTAPAARDLPRIQDGPGYDAGLQFLPQPGRASVVLAAAPPGAGGGTSRAVYRSGDGGLTWSRVFTSPDDPAARVRVIGFTTAPGRAYLLLETPGPTPTGADPFQLPPIERHTTLYRSTDGATWTVVAGRPDILQPWVVSPDGLLADPLHPDRLADAEGLFSADGGQTWAGPGTGLPAHPLLLTAAVAGANGWLAASHLQVYRSTDAGHTWHGIYQADDGLFSAVTGLALTDSSLLIFVHPAKVTGGPGGHYERAPVLLRSADGGATWGPVLAAGGGAARFAGGEAGAPLYLAVAPEYDYGSGSYVSRTADGGLFRSGDGGATWTPLRVGMVVNNVALDPANAGHLLAAGDDGMAESTDAGATWHPIVASPPVGGLVAAGGRSFYAYEVHGYNGEGDITKLGPVRGPLYRSTDGGQHWGPVPIPGAPAGFQVAALAASGANDLAVAWTDPKAAGPGPGQVARSSDGGQSWTLLNRLGLPGLCYGSDLTLAATPGEILLSNCGLWSYRVAESPADPAFAARWAAQDRPVAAGQAPRGWTWGPAPVATLREPLAGLPGGSHLVQYYDKSRMEVNDPAGDRSSPWFVTNGLLVVEMVAGRMQTGLTTWEPRPAATLPVAGDAVYNNPAPSYAAWRSVASVEGSAHRAANRVGQPVAQSLDASGSVGGQIPLTATVTLAAYDAAAGHNLATPFQEFLQRTGPVEVGGKPGVGRNFSDPLVVMGHPISEPYWAQMRVGGADRWVLIQLFERRVLTYTPSNPAPWQVEMGNVGLHYYTWRYGDSR
jgi:photosystem II stability/assembly factor-like uncharacterized protein